jgi:hypothetical protein
MNMGKKLSTFYKDDSKSFCEIHVDLKEEMFYIKYFDNKGNRFCVEDFPGRSLRYVEDAAENWTLGIKVIEEGHIQYGLL